MYYGPFMIDVKETKLTLVEQRLIRHPQVGGIVFFTRNYKNMAQFKSLVSEIREIAGKKPLLLAVDHEGGRVWRFNEGFTKLPAARYYGNLYDIDKEAALKLSYQAGWIMAAELLDCGVDLSLAPVLDMDKGISLVIGDRAFHTEPTAITELAKAFIEGMNKVGMHATGKHFPGHGGCAPDSHVEKPVDTRDLETLMKEDLIPFLQLSSQLKAIMPAHITYPQIDDLPVGFSKKWLQEILRKKLHFQGAIISDCLSMKGAAIEGDFVKRAQLALEAGCDMVILCQQEPELLEWVLNHLERNTTQDSHYRLAALAGSFQQMARLEPRPTLLV